MIASCGHDERGKYRGGTAGDQTGTEWYTRKWYKPSYGWDVVLRHPDSKVGTKVAEIATAAANNNKIGYDQGERLTFYNQLKAANWRPENITTNCESDCSASTAACVIAAGHQLGMPALQRVNPSCWTGNLKAALVAAGYTALTASKYLTSETYLQAGDIILSESHHVVIKIDGAINTVSTATNSKPKYVIGQTYTTQVELNVRCGPGISYRAKKHSQLTASGQNHDKDGDGALDKGTRVTCNAVKTVGNDIWIMCPSGWIAAYYNGHVYVK